MTEQLHREKPDIKAYSTFHEDGINDLVLGFVLLAAGISFKLDLSIAAMIWLPVLFIQPLKKKITLPRVDLTNINSEDQKKRNIKMMTVLTLVLVLGVVFFFLRSSSNVPAWLDNFISKNILILIGVILGGTLFVKGRILGAKRFLNYGILVVALFASARYTGLGLEEILIITGTIMFLSGWIVLIKFLQKYPVIKGEES